MHTPRAAASPAVTATGSRHAGLLARCREFVDAAEPIAVHGRLTRVSGLVLEASGLSLPVGSVCRIEHERAGPGADVEAEVVGFAERRLFLMPTSSTLGLTPGARVTPLRMPVRPPTLVEPSHPWRRTADRMRHLPLGEGLLGRVVDAQGAPLDSLGPLADVRLSPIHRRPINAMQRDPVRQPLACGVRAIDALTTVGRGQRLGLFAGPGVGKSVLLGMMARHTQADAIVVGLIGERGREVKEFVEDILGPGGLDRSAVVAAPADSPPLLRMQGAHYATAIAEELRDRGRHVLLLLDSLTRYAMAGREIALAIGEPPATKGYPASVFARLPMLLERTGNGAPGEGSITAFYTVLSEGDDLQDPVADAARSFLDGHVVLTRALAESGHFPAIDIEQSLSRVMSACAEDRHQRLARRCRALWSRWQRTQDLVAVGAYVAGADPETDLALAIQPRIAQFLRQDLDEGAVFGDTVAALEALIGPTLEA